MSALPAIDRLRRFVDRGAGTGEAVSGCDLCAAPLGTEHAHLADRGSRALLCACPPCHLLFTADAPRAEDGASGGRYRAVPRRDAAPEPVGLEARHLEALDVPVGIAFFVRSPSGDIRAYYPSPAGPTESLLPLVAWDLLVSENPRLTSLLPSVEALLVRRTREALHAWVVPVDRCFELVGRIRRTYRGFDGGDESRAEMSTFFARLEETALTSTPPTATRSLPS